MCKIGILFRQILCPFVFYDITVIIPFHTEAEVILCFTIFIKYERTENLSKQETEQKGVISADILSKENAGCGIQDAHALRKENKDNIKYAVFMVRSIIS